MKKKFIIKDARRLLAEQINSSQIVEGKNMNIETMSKMKGLSEVIRKTTMVIVPFTKWTVPMG